MKKATGSLLAGLALLLLLLLIIGDGSSDMVLFVGRLHPAIVHLPIGVLLAAIGLDYWSRRSGKHENTVTTLFYVGAWTAIAAAVAGLLLGTGGGYEPDTFSGHKRLGVLVAIGSTALYMLRLRAWSALTLIMRRTYLSLTAIVALFILLTGHLGAELTHGAGYLTRYMPDGMRSLAGLPAKEDLGKLHLKNPSEATVYEALVQPVLSNRCVSCHGMQVARGGLRLDSAYAIFEGGDEGPAIVAGRSDESELIKRVWLPLSAPGHMPPEGRPQVTIAEAELIRWWIDDGALTESTLSDAEFTSTVESILDGYGLGEIRTGIFALDVAPPDAADVAALAVLGVSVVPLAENEPFLQVRCTDPLACTGESFTSALRRLEDNIAWLDLGRTAVGDSSLPAVGQLKHLTRLYLQQTNITDTGLQHLGSLAFLEYLNLYGTAVSDTGLVHLEGLESLRSLYLWQSDATPSGVASLNEALPDLEITLGLELTPDSTVTDP